MAELTPLGRSSFVVAIAAVNRPAVSRLEGHLCFFAASSTHRREHLSPGRVARRAVARRAVPLRSLRCAATLAALGLIGIASRGKVLLFFGTEGESDPAVGALK